MKTKKEKSVEKSSAKGQSPSVGTGDWLAVFCRYGATDYHQHDTKAEAKDSLKYGEDNGDIYGLAVYQRSTKRLFMHDPLNATDEAKLRKKIDKLLSANIASETRGHVAPTTESGTDPRCL